MANHKKELFTNLDAELADFAKAIAHPARIAILRELAKRESCICGEIVEVLPLAQSTVSQHLKALKAAGLIQGTISGAKSCYCINSDRLADFMSRIKDLETLLLKGELSNNNCC